MEIKRVTTGNYVFDLNVDIQPKVQAAILEKGVKTSIQKALLLWEKTLAYPDVTDASGKVVKKVARPSGFKRKMIPFSKEGADLLEKFVGLAKIDIAPDDAEEKEMEDLGISDVKNIGEWTGAEVGAPVYKRAQDNIMNYLFEADGKTPKKTKAGEDRSLETFVEAMVNRGVDVETPTEPWTADKEFLKKIQDWLIEEDKKKNDSMD